VTGVQNAHKYTKNAKDTVTAVLTAGMDTDCGGFMNSKTMLPLMDDPQILKLVDTALTHLFKVQFRLGFADPPSLVPWAHYGSEKVNTPEHQALAKYAADSSIVLLKNLASTLPLKKKPGMKLLVAGRNANATTNMQGNYFGTAPYLISPCEGLAQYGEVSCSTDPEKAPSLQGMDAVVLVVGLTSEGVGRMASHGVDESEGHDRTSLLLPYNQDALISSVASQAAASKVPVVVVVMGGGPLDLSKAKANTGVGAIMWCGYPGPPYNTQHTHTHTTHTHTHTHMYHVQMS
jgi:beta-D-xylosidase 4